MKNKNNQTIFVALVFLIIISVGVAILIGSMTIHRKEVVVTGNSPPPTATPTPAATDINSDMTSKPNSIVTQELQTPQTENTSVPVEQISLTISQPANGTQTTSSTIVVQGKTLPYADVFVNDKQISADATGNFSQSISLDEGENVIAVSANDSNGNYAEKEITVTYNSPQTQ